MYACPLEAVAHITFQVPGPKAHLEAAQIGSTPFRAALERSTIEPSVKLRDAARSRRYPVRGLIQPGFSPGLSAYKDPSGSIAFPIHSALLEPTIARARLGRRSAWRGRPWSQSPACREAASHRPAAQHRHSH